MGLVECYASTLSFNSGLERIHCSLVGGHKKAPILGAELDINYIFDIFGDAFFLSSF